jgi:hypothetical protein
MTREHKTDHSTLSLAAQVERPATNTNPGGHMSEDMVTPPDWSGTLFDTEPVVDRSGVTEDTEGLVRRDGSDTSRAAAGRPTGRSRIRVLLHLTEHGPATDPEIATALDMSPNTQRPRRVELVSGGYVADSGERRVHHGSAHIVWAATNAGRAAARELESAA